MPELGFELETYCSQVKHHTTEDLYVYSETREGNLFSIIMQLLHVL